MTPARLTHLLLLLLLPLPLHAQRTGSVSGRVLCADTHGPARMAGVYLIPITDPRAGAATRSEATVTRVTPAGLDGSFLIPDVRPGNYYVVAEKPGYLSPLTLISREQLKHPDKQTADLMARLLTPASVVAGHGTRVEATIFRGAVLNGSVHFDDGSPVTGVSVLIARKSRDGKWAALPRGFVASPGGDTDDQGRFRISGLPEGQYRIHTALNLSDVEVSRDSGGSESSSSDTRFSLNLYFDGAFRESAAKTIKLAEAEESSAIDLTVPLSTLHTLSGSVVRGGGQIVNAAKVALLWSDTKEELTATTVRPGDSSFHFDFVPEGDYILHVTEARDVTRTEIPNCTTGVCAPASHTEEKVLERFGDADQPLTLHTDLQSINVPVPAPAAK